jgi:pimeloyl-ACP methyl ester carboxylesterase
MSSKKRDAVQDLRAASRLAIEATVAITAAVEKMHATIAAGPAVLGRPLDGPASLFTGLAYVGVRGATERVGAAIDLGLAQLAPLLGESTPGPERAALLSALNGVLGDYLAQVGNPLAIEMELALRPPAAAADPAETAAPVRAGGPTRKRLLVLVHGSCMNDRQWLRGGHDHGEALARELGYEAAYLHYNSGLHISTNGREFAQRLEELVHAGPAAVEEIVVVAHSMGGLVTRSACHAAEQADLRWRRALRSIVFLGTPHHGAPLERGGNWADVLLGASSYSAPLARLATIRSAGVTDLRYGNVLDEHWQGRDRFEMASDPRSPVPLPTGVACFAVAGDLGTRLLRDVVGDGLVPVASALGQHADPGKTLAFAPENTWTASGVGHLGLLDGGELFERVRDWLAA